DGVIRRTPGTSYPKLRTMNAEPPLRGALSFAYFSLGKQRKVRLNKQKSLNDLINATRRGIDEKFCVPTLE
ncbi:MAG: hypothetical protein IJR52_07160, partial [Selenomonadaceae bacterium]|nr:hypothetical protein [Selenomonadaceae bacterium]